MRLWTVQPKNILDEVNQTGYYRCDKNLSYNLSKKNSLEAKYQWLIDRMEKRIGNRPDGVSYPIWAWHTWKGIQQSPEVNSAVFLTRTEEKVLLTLEIPDEEVVLTDFDGWQIVLDNGYLSNEVDENKIEELQTYIESLDGDRLRQEIENSWENVFDTTRIQTPYMNRGYYIQATFWQLKKEYIIDEMVLYQNSSANS